MAALPRAVCRVCRRSVALRANGTFREHLDMPAPYPAEQCWGGGLGLQDIDDAIDAGGHFRERYTPGLMAMHPELQQR